MRSKAKLSVNDGMSKPGIAYIISETETEQINPASKAFPILFSLVMMQNGDWIPIL